MKIRCTVCGAPNETEAGFDTAYCLTCGSQIPVSEALEYRFSRNMLANLSTDSLVQLAKEAYRDRQITPETLALLKIAAPSGDVEIHYLIGYYYFNIKDFAQATPYLYIAAEKMYPDAMCLYAVSKYMMNPNDKDAYPRICKYLTTAQETFSKIFDKIDGAKLLEHLNSVIEAQAQQAAQAPVFPPIPNLPD